VLGEGEDGAVGGEVGGDRGPGFAGVGGLEQVGLEVVVLVVFKRHVDGVGVEARGQDAADQGAVGHAGEFVVAGPVGAAVEGHLHQSIVGARPHEAFLFGRLGDVLHLAELGGGAVLGHRVGAPDAAHHRQRVAVERAGEVAADLFPGVAAVVAAEDLVGRHVEAVVVEGADEEGRVPSPAEAVFARRRLRLDGDVFVGAQVDAAGAAGLGLGVNDVGVGGIHRVVEAVAAVGDAPVGAGQAIAGVGARGASLVVVVLGAAVDVVERLGVVHRHVHVLAEREVRLPFPRGGAVPALVEAAVAADEVVIGVGGINPDDVVIDVFVGLAQLVEGGAAVVGDGDGGVEFEDAVGVFGVGGDLSVVHGPGLDGVALLPRCAAVGRAEDAALALGRLDRGVEDARVGRRDGQADAAQADRGQAAAFARPVRAAVGGLVDAALGAAVNQCVDVALALVGGSVEGVGIARIHDQVAGAGVLGDGEHVFPGGAAVGGLEHAAVAARAPERSLGGDIDGVGVARIDDDAADVAGILESHVAPGGAAVVGAVDAV